MRPKIRIGFAASSLALLLAVPAFAADSGAERTALERIAHPPLGLPQVEYPAANVPTPEKFRLGRKLFYDTRLSREGNMACGTCHLPEQGFAVNGFPTAIGKGGKALRRNAPTVLNVAYQRTMFRDGRRATIERQALDPFLSREEMDNPSLLAVMDKIRALPDYDGLFEDAFGRGPTPDGLAYAIATYERTLLAADSPFDRWFFGKDEAAISESAKRGFELFRGQGVCAACHVFSEDNALFTDHKFRDVGTGWKRSRTGASGEHRFHDANTPGSTLQDFGRFEVTNDPADLFLYKTPSLRNVALTAPYMHDGSMASLRDVVDYYNRGGFHGYGIDPLIRPLGLNDDQKEDLVEFLKSLTSEGVNELIAEARGAANAE